MTASLAPQFVFKAFDANGNPLVGGQLFTYQAGTSIPLATYTDATGETTATNPVVLDSLGQAVLWLGPSPYRFNLLDAAGDQMADYPIDQVVPPARSSSDGERAESDDGMPKPRLRD